MRQDNKKKGSGKQPARKNTKREESAHLWHFESMDRVNQAMQGTNDLEEMMKRVLDTLLSVFECDRAFLVYPCDPEAVTWQVPMERTRPEYPGALPIGIEMPLTPPGAEVFRNLRAANGPVRFGPGLENEVDPDIRQNFRIQSYIAMALYPKIGKPWSFGLHQCSYVRDWTAEEERLFQEIGRRLADSLSILLAFRNTQESEKRIKQLIDASPVAMVVSSGDDERVEWVNEKFTELFGYTVEDMPDVEHWWPLAYPDEAYRAEIRMRWEASAEQAIREMGEISPMEATVRCKDGSQRHIEFRLSSIGEKHLVTFVDLTERKRMEEALSASEAELRTLINAMTDVIFVGNSEGRFLKIVDTNPSLLYKPSKELLGKTLHEVFPKDQADFFLNHLRQALDTQRSVNFEYSLLIGDKKLWFYATASPMTHDKTLMVARDITDRKQAEEALRESEERYRQLVNLSPDGISIYSQGRIVFVNPAMTRMSGATSANQLIGKSVLDLVHPNFRDVVQKRMHEMHITGQSIPFIEERLLRLDGSCLDVEFAAIPYHFNGTQHVQVVARDITERKQMTEALAEREREFRTLAEYSPDNIARYDINCRTIYVNPTLERTLGRPASEMLGTLPAEMGFIKEAKEYQEKMVEVLKTGKENEMNLVLPDAGEGLRYHNIRFVAERGADGTITGIQAIGRDLTEHKRAEMALSRERELLRTLVDNLPEEVYVKDRERRFLFVNELLVRALGAQSMDEVIGKRDEDFWPPYLAKQFADEENELMRTGKPLLNDEHTPPHKSGPKRWLLRTKLPLRDGAGNIIGLVGMGSDITERKHAEQAVRESEERLRQITSSLREVVWLRDAKTRQVLYVNPAFQELTGRTRESFYENRDIVADAIYPDDREEVTQALDQRSPSVPFDKEHRIIHLNGSVRWVSSQSFPVRNEAGEVYRWATIMEDITERKLAGESLRESERRLVAAQRMAHVGYWERDFDSNRVMLSDEACRIFGIAERGLSLNLDEWHPRWVALIHPDDQPRLIELLGDVLAGIRSYDVEYRVIRPDGAVRFIYSQAEVKRDASGHAQNMLGMMQDITERKQAELALRASENRFRVLSENAFVGIYIIQDGRLSYCNSTQAKIFGYTPEELIGTDPRLLVHPDDQAMVLENIRRRIDGEIETIHYEFRGRCKDGSIKNIEVLGGRIDFGGKTAVIGNLMDITDRKRAEDEIARSLAAEKKARKVAEILREANESLSRTLHLDDVLQNLLQYLLQLVPYDSANVMLREGDTQFRVVALRGYEHWTNLDATRNLVFDIHTIPSLNELVTTQKSIIIENTYEYLGWIRVPGTEHVVSWLGIPIITDGQVIGLYSVDKVDAAFFTDEHRLLAEGLAAQAAVAIQNTRLHDQITRANVELEQRVASRTAQLEEANKELEAFAYSVSHDLRAPLRHVDGFIDMLQKRTKTTLDDKSQHYMEVIADSAKQMGILIDDLLSFSRMGRNEMFKSQVDLGELVDDVVRELRPEAEGRDIQWKISPLPLVTGDRAMLRMVLVNLISNALKFTRSRKTAQIEIGCEEKNETETVIFVRDNGVGFDMNYFDKLFGVFQRLHRQEDFEGTGIGLANVRRIINRHGGRAWADGQIDHGATFYFSLPNSK